MKPKIKLKRKNSHHHLTPKTKDDFVRWLKEKRALKEKTMIANARRDLSQALMVWADDGGAAGISPPLSKTREQSQAIKEKNHEQGKR